MRADLAVRVSATIDLERFSFPRMRNSHASGVASSQRDRKAQERGHDFPRCAQAGGEIARDLGYPAATTPVVDRNFPNP
jgi:hypothetical protein